MLVFNTFKKVLVWNTHTNIFVIKVCKGRYKDEPILFVSKLAQIKNWSLLFERPLLYQHWSLKTEHFRSKNEKRTQRFGIKQQNYRVLQKKKKILEEIEVEVPEKTLNLRKRCAWNQNDSN